MQLRCPGEITYIGPDDNNLSSFQCSEAFTIVPETHFDPSTLDPTLMVGAFGTGIFILVPVWAALIGLKILLKPLLSKY